VQSYSSITLVTFYGTTQYHATEDTFLILLSQRIWWANICGNINMDVGDRSFEDLTASVGSPSSRSVICNNVFPHFLAAPKASTSDSLIQQVLLYNQCTPVACSRQGLSPEAVRVLDELPDLSFLQAKLLMFPVQGTLL